MSTILIELQYLPPISYFSLIAKCDQVILEKHEHFQKQTYRNRCYINSSQGREMLVVPVTSKHGKPLITDVKVDYSQKWNNKHWRALQTAYGKAPFFEFYVHDLHDILFKKYSYLYELNFHLLSLCLRWLRLDIELKESITYEKEPFRPIIDHRNSISPKKNVLLETNDHNLFRYTQVFGSKFVGDLSIVDLVFCKGPEAGGIILPSSSIE